MSDEQFHQLLKEIHEVKQEVRDLSDKIGMLPDISLAAILALTETIDERSKGSNRSIGVKEWLHRRHTLFQEILQAYEHN